MSQLTRLRTNLSQKRLETMVLVPWYTCTMVPKMLHVYVHVCTMAIPFGTYITMVLEYHGMVPMDAPGGTYILDVGAVCPGTQRYVD